MKKLFVLFTLLAGVALQTAQAQESVPYDQTKKKIIYTEVVEVPGVGKDKLYDKAYNTLTNIYNQAEKKMETKDKAAGKISMKCTTRVMLMDPKTKMEVADKDFIKYKLDISFKDGKYKYEFYDFHIDKGGFKYPVEKFVEKDHTVDKATRADEKLAYLHKDITGIIAQLKEGIATDKTTTKEDW